MLVVRDAPVSSFSIAARVVAYHDVGPCSAWGYFQRQLIRIEEIVHPLNIESRNLHVRIFFASIPMGFVITPSGALLLAEKAATPNRHKMNRRSQEHVSGSAGISDSVPRPTGG
jgi:hypothetical protein